MFAAGHTQWLTDTPLVEGLVERLGPSHSADVQVRRRG